MAKTIALDEVTHMRLAGLRANLVLAILRDPDRYPAWMSHGHLSYDDVLSFLMDQREKAGERKAALRRLRQQQRQRKPPAILSLPNHNQQETPPVCLRRPVPPDLMPPHPSDPPE